MLTITISDPDTIALLQKYQRFIEQTDSVDGSLDQIAEGLILGSIDEHPQFTQWRFEARTHTAAPAPTIEHASVAVAFPFANQVRRSATG